MLARLDEYKGLDTLLDAAQLMREPVHIAIAGDGPLAAAVKARIASDGLNNIELVGTKDADSFLQDVELLVLPSRLEALPVCIIEAMRASRAVVATDIGGVRELVAHGTTGLIVPVDDAVSLAQALDSLAGDAEQRGAMGQAGRRRYLQRFTAEQMASQYVALYESLEYRRRRWSGLRHRGPSAEAPAGSGLAAETPPQP